ncbi:MAG: acetyl-CoA carboxylase biotin carboxyl carrier protein [Brevinema sp.]
MNSMKDIKKIYEMFSGLDIDCIDVESQEGTFSITFGDGKKMKPAVAPVPAPVVAPAPTAPKKPASTQSNNDILSPAVGIFERSNPRTGEYYIKLRDVVKVGQIVGHVLVLGVRHDVVAKISGKVIEMLVEDEQPIEYGQPIFRLEKLNEDA